MTTSENMNKVSDRFKPIKDAVRDLAHDAKEGTSEVGSDLNRLKTEVVAAVKEALNATFGDAKGKASDAYETLREKSSDYAHTVEQTVVRRPLTSLAIAAGVGLLLGLCMSASRHDD